MLYLWLIRLRTAGDSVILGGVLAPLFLWGFMVRSKYNARRIIQFKAGWRLKITYPVHMRDRNSPEYLCDFWFGAREYGSMSKALSAAVTARDQLEAEYDLRPVNWMKITGLTHRVRFMEDRQRPWAAYRVSWRETINNERKNRSKDFNYNINSQSDKKRAFQQALKFNKEIRKEHYS